MENETRSTGTAHRNRLKYTGRENDYATGLYYYRARYYDPEVGRFLTEDPMGFAAGINFYAYVNNNPINANDPSGNFAVLADWIVDHYLRNENNPSVDIITASKSWNERDDDQEYFHQIGLGNEGNRVFTSPDGHGEAVFDINAQLVSDAVNKGTYNYYSAEESPIMHAVADVAPSVVFGNGLDDPRSFFDRVGDAFDVGMKWLEDAFSPEEDLIEQSYGGDEMEAGYYFD
ncbi:MAG: RHS repeat-associated core domain-containing protein [Candidatus Nitrohelix vancouverensis]|uniref:RHS repeat-associated core domain-containing protein n=1 Tax=Candidatus Nitrohelix vancouverensis TaxID=2705534 RepID=A0A7T0G4U9_9BACT|nr:MAG: RHS repeat-associated core domain-containing protein [Candidatus Nitrohelix vancouverensis]